MLEITPFIPLTLRGIFMKRILILRGEGLVCSPSRSNRTGSRSELLDPVFLPIQRVSQST